ncbi:hypothetical protein LJC11_03240 [Bacteroidales bacterium OttesenSCG-928-I21]|nr:hypothetical protein [Bacteroidales bacterium OttesenSCG-928-I21]
MKRKAEINIVVGINGTGKTTFLKDSVLKHSKRTLVLTPYMEEWENLTIVSTAKEIYNFTGNSRIICTTENIKSVLELIQKNFHGGTLIMDDTRHYLDAHTIKPIEQICIQRRQRGMDVYVVGHSLMQIPPKFFDFASGLILFYSEQSRNRELSAEVNKKIEAAQERIKKQFDAGNPYHKEIIILDMQIRAQYVAEQRKNNR